MRVAVTGAGGDFGTAILRTLLPDERVDDVVGIDLVAPRLEHPKLRAERCDVRSSRIRDLFEGCESVLHLAFILIPGRDLAEAHSVNLDGSRNVLEATADAGARRLVVASSLSAYGVPEKGLPAVDEEMVPEGSPDHFYFREKAEVEGMLDRWEREHPDSGLTITRMRPGFIYGPDFSNPAVNLMGTRLAVLPDDGGRTQLIHQDDLARAFCEATFRDAPGPFLIVTEDSISMDEMAEMSGGRVVRVPKRVARIAVDLAHSIRVSPISGDWAVSGDRVGALGRARDQLGWEPSMSSRESALVLLAQHGRELRFVDGPPRDEVIERMLEVPTGFMREAATTIPGLAGFDPDEALEGLRHEWLEHKGHRIHLEVHESGPGAPTLVIAPGLGDHARRLTPLAAGLRDEGMNAIVVDRQGHGISEGRRGDATLDDDFDVLELAIAHARSRFAGPVVIGGDSLGGIMTWYLLTREPDVDAAFCHDIAHPEVHHDPSMRFKAPAMRALARVAPHAPIPLRQIADYDQVALEPLTKSYFDSERDRLFNFSITARSAASYLAFRPGIPWERVEVPVLVLAGAEDRMVPREFAEAALARAKPPLTTYLPIEGAGHQLFLDHLSGSLPPLVEWARDVLSRTPASV